MIKFDVITLYPEIFDFYFSQGLLAKAQKKGLVKIKAHNLRDFTLDKQRTACPPKCGAFGRVDDKPFGGGRGMVLKVEPLLRAVSTLKIQSSLNQSKPRTTTSCMRGKLGLGRAKSKKIKNKNKIVLLSPRGKKFNQKMAVNWSKLDQLIIIAGRYEGVDERAAKYLADEVISLGNYVLMSGDVGAIAVIEAVARLAPGVVGHSENMLKERLTKTKGFVEYPQYTRPEVIEIAGHKRRAPKVLLSGHHKQIAKWRAKHSKVVE